jgi:hypothetical protein
LTGIAGDRRGGVARTVERVSLELPGWVVDAFNVVGLPWPGIDEDQLRGWATDLRQFSAEITALSGQSKSAVAELTAHSQSAFTKTLTSAWEHYHGVITGLGGPMDAFATALDAAADAVVAQKGVVIGAAVLLAGEVIATQGEALVTFGAAEAEVPAEVMATRLVVKAALQELEGQLLGILVTKAAAEISAHLGGAIARLVSGGGQVGAEAVALKADYGAMQTLATALTGHGARVDHTAVGSYRRAATRRLDTGGPGGGWREVATAIGQAVLRVLVQAFKDLGHTICAIVLDTIKFLRTATAKLTHTDAALARTIRAGGRRVADSASSGGASSGGGAGGRGGPTSGNGGTPDYEYNMIENPGPIAGLRGNPAANFAGGRYDEVTLRRDTTLYRGGTSGTPLGQWFTRERPASIAQVRIDTAVRPQWIDPKTGAILASSPIDTVYRVKIPAGTKIYPGPTANQGDIYVGGKEQIFVPRPWSIPGVEVTGSESLK